MLHINPRRSLAGIIVLAAIVLAMVVRSSAGSAQTSLISADQAMTRALEIAQDDGIFGGLINQPSEIRGAVMTYGQAIQTVFGTPIQPSEQVVKLRDAPVWLVILNGEFVEHVPSSADGSIPAQDVVHSQMAIIIDANTAEAMEQVLISPQKLLAVTSLPILARGVSTPLPMPTRVPIVTEVPLPTLQPFEE